MLSMLEMTVTSVPCSDLAYDIHKLYDKDPLGNVLIDKKKLEKTLLLSYVCNTKAGELRGGAPARTCWLLSGPWFRAH